MKKAYCTTGSLALVLSMVALTLVAFIGVTGLGIGSAIKDLAIEMKRKNDMEENKFYGRPQKRN